MKAIVKKTLAASKGIKVEEVHRDRVRGYLISLAEIEPKLLFEPVSHSALLITSSTSLDQMLGELTESPQAFIDDPYSTPAITTIEYFCTAACNYRCGYCYLGKSPSRVARSDLAPEAAITRLDNLFTNRRIAPFLQVLFIGGEPLLAWQGLTSVVGAIVDLSNRFGIETSFAVTTNGSLLSADVLKFFRKHSFRVTISHDGPMQSTNRCARDASEQIEWIKRSLDVLGPQKLRTSCTVQPGQFRNQKEVFDFFLSLGLKRIFISAIQGRSIRRQDVEANVLGICDPESHTHRLGCSEGHLQNAWDSIMKRDLASSHCAAGKGHVVLDSSGTLSMCANLRRPELQAKMSSYYHVDSDAVCGRCGYRYLCNGGCRAWRIMRGSTCPDEMECTSDSTRFTLVLRRLLLSQTAQDR